MGARVPRTARRLLLTAVAVSITATALLAIGVLLFGSFGETEGRILGSTMILAGYALLALPAGFLLTLAVIGNPAGDERMRPDQAFRNIDRAKAFYVEQAGFTVEP